MKSFKGHYFAKRLLLALPRLLVFILDHILPKNKNLWVFAVGKHPFNSNQRALFEYVKDQTSVQPIALLYPKKSVPEGLCLSECIWANSWQGFFMLLRARVIVVHHGRGDFYYWGISSKKHIILNVWHGVPIKVIGRLEHSTLTLSQKISAFFQKKFYRHDYTYTLTSSTLDRLSMSASFNEPFQHFLVTGLPRNDWLINDKVFSSDYFNREEARVVSFLQKKRLILYAPTFREKGRSMYVFSENELESLEVLLSNYNAVLGVRAHINEQVLDTWQHREYIKILDIDCFPETQAILSQTDVLITDYSGIWVDFLLKSKPILGFVYDLEDYTCNQRPLMYGFKEIFPGALCHTFDDLLKTLVQTLENTLNMTDPKQKWVSDLFHQYQDGNACERIHQYLQQNL